MSDIVTRPRGQNPDVFNKSLRGFYGEFKSDASFPISFIQTTVKVDEIDVLKTATEAFSTSNLDFEELIQRDIDQKRVKSIVDNYLKKGKDRVLFFPPLLVSLIAVNGNDQISDYAGVTHEPNPEDGEVRSTWGTDRFQVILPFNPSPTGYQYKTDDDEYEVLPYWSILRINTNKMRLVVIDGQHRLSALKYLASSSDPANQRVVQSMSVPICVLFPPGAVQGNANHESVNRDLRELFVRINSTSRQVSGHFLTLLNDNSLSSFAIREFCELCKTDEILEGFTSLNLVEWNQRETRFASQTNRAYSITTIQIISDVLKDYAFHEKEGLPSTLLNLAPYQDELELDHAIPLEQISESNFSASQINRLQKIMEESIAPALKILFFDSRPYKARVISFKEAAEKLNKYIANDQAGADYFKTKVLQQYREVNEFDGAEPALISNRFSENYKQTVNSEDEVFLLNVFQQGLVRVWIDWSGLLAQYGIAPIAVAELLVLATEPVCFDTSSRLFDNERIYLQKLLFNGARVVVSKRAKTNWKRLISASILNQKSKKSLKAALDNLLSESADDAYEELINSAENCFDSYLEDLNRAYKNDYEKHWVDKDFPAQVMKDLEQLSKKAKSGDMTAKDKLEEKLHEYAEQRHQEASQKLRASLRIS